MKALSVRPNSPLYWKCRVPASPRLLTVGAVLWTLTATFSIEAAGGGEALSEREILEVFYHATNGGDWTENSGWTDPDKPLAEWEGVTVEEGSVTDISLYGNNLSGTIPSEIGELKELKVLNLANNALTGGIPPELGDLDELEFLQLVFNELSGELPLELMGLANLESLGISGNDDLCVPPDTEFHDWLKSVGVSPSDLPACPSPDDRDALIALYEATGGDDWDNNSGWLDPDVPVWQWYGVEKMGDRVTRLYLWENNLTGSLPSELGDLTGIEELDLADNELMGELPMELTQLENLQTLSIGGNTGLCAPADSAFQEWLADVRHVSGDLPTCVIQEDREALVALYKATGGDDWDNNTGWLDPDVPVSDWHGVAATAEGRVDELLLFSNNLTGEIPAEVGDLEKLRGLLLTGNNLAGEVPSELAALTELEVLHVNDNELTGELPFGLMELENMARLLARDNAGLCAPADAEFQTWMEELWSADGIPTCVIREDIDALGALYEATGGEDWDDNTGWLDPDVPVWEWHGVNQVQDGRVVQLVLFDNNLSGFLPVEIGNMSALEVLVIQDNDLSGPLPATMKSISLETFLFHETELCEPQDEAFQDWLDAISSLSGTGVPCPEEMTVEAFGQWLEAHWDAEELEDPARTEPEGDPDSLGIPNLLRYAFDLDPRDPARSGLPKPEAVKPEGKNDVYLTITYTRRTDADDIEYRVEAGDRLDGWETLPEELAITESAVAPGLDSVTVRDEVPAAENNRRYLRVVVELSEEEE